MARRILAREPRSLHAVTVGLSASGPLEFLRERKSLHNLFGYRRRQSRWWRSTGLWGWWNGIGLHGLVELGSITETEFVSALQRQGTIHLRPIAIETVRAEVYRAAQSVSASPDRVGTGRYQPCKIAIEPVAVAARTKPIIGNIVVEPMAMIF